MPMNSLPSCEYTMEHRGFVMFSHFQSYCALTEDKTSSFRRFSLFDVCLNHSF